MDCSAMNKNKGDITILIQKIKSAVASSYKRSNKMAYLKKSTFRISLMKSSILHYSDYIKLQPQFILIFRRNRKDNIMEQNVGNDTFGEENTSILKLFILVWFYPIDKKPKKQKQTYVLEKQLD